MALVLGTIFMFIAVGLVSKRFDWRQQLLIVLTAATLAALQFAFPRFL